MLPTSRCTSSSESPSPFISAGRVAMFQNSAMFWEQKKTASFCRNSFETARVACGQSGWLWLGAAQENIRVNKDTHQ
jgi:hypothetical protein